ncbi:MAG TPA: peptide chain release factor-like protein [Acidimicrobiales bacterium]|nr:peptide chain release factor-like protein [Acidimicrobiales bacterium]
MGADGLGLDLAELTVRVDTAGGPGGQHANRTKSRVTVELDLRTVASLDQPTVARLREVFGDVVRATSSVSRRQGENRRIAEERLVSRLEAALAPVAIRRATRPTSGAVQRRLSDKRRRASVKRLRRDRDDADG